MDKRRRKARLRTPRSVCKLSRPAGLFAALVVAVAVPSCVMPARIQTVSLASLESAPSAPLYRSERFVVRDAARLQSLCTPLGPRLGLVQVRKPADYDALKTLVPELGPCPDLRRGMLIGLACWAGTPIDGRWPVELTAVQVQSGGGLLTAQYRGGTYYPDGTGRLVTEYVPDLTAVLVVDVNGTSFYPDEEVAGP
jgi:hypothetical protein